LRRLAFLALAAACLAHADEPLLTEDTGVVRPGQWQLELHGERARDPGVRREHLGATLSRGMVDGLEAQLDVPYARLNGKSGLADASLAAKWRFYERDGFSAAFKPELFLPTGREEDGLGAGRAGWAAGIAAAREWHAFELIGHLRYTANRNRVGEREALRHASAALLWSASERLRLMADYARETSADPADSALARSLVVGALYELSEAADLGVGYQRGRSRPAEDRVLRAGVKLRW
jgi:hypothetical protein